MDNKSTHNENARLTALIKEVQQKNRDLELHREKVEMQNIKARRRTIELFGKMIDLKKAKKIIVLQNEELEKKNEEINRKRTALEHTYVKFRKRTIELFGKMVDLRKAYNIINNQKKEIEQQRKKLHELNASKDKFFSIIAHDLKNPIAGFLGLTEVMAMDMKSFSDEEKQEFINLLYDSSKQLHSLLENLLQWSRAQTGRLSFKPRKLQAHKIISDNFSLLNANAEVKNIELINDVDPNMEVWADADMVNTIIRNLLTNAMKFSHKNSTVKITSEPEDKFLSICIVDSGVGISENELEKLFKIGYNASKPGTANEEGTGLGLILCKEFAKRNGGDVRVKSEVNKGSTFSLTLPIYQQKL
jgi:signal transduction histidine kinase